MAPCAFGGFICCYTDLDILTCPPEHLCCEGLERFICCETECCAKAGKEQFPVGMIKEDGKICKIGLPCCVCSLFMPDATDLIKCAYGFLCFNVKGQFPFGGDTPAPICSIYGAQCSFKDGFAFGCCTPAYEAGFCTSINPPEKMENEAPTPITMGSNKQ